MKRLTLLLLGLALSALAAAESAHKASGKVTEVDRGKARVTIQHGPVPSLKWPPMTMAFDVKDAALLAKVKPGAKVEFSFIQSGRDYVITDLK